MSEWAEMPWLMAAAQVFVLINEVRPDNGTLWRVQDNDAPARIAELEAEVARLKRLLLPGILPSVPPTTSAELKTPGGPVAEEAEKDNRFALIELD